MIHKVDHMFLKTIPRSLNILISVALITLLLKVFLLNGVPEVFNGAYELGVILEGVLGSVLASYVFYLIVVHLKEVNDKKVVYSHIIKWAKLVVGDCKSQLIDFGRESKIDLPFLSLTQGQVD